MNAPTGNAKVDRGGEVLAWYIGSTWVGAMGVLTGVTALAFLAPIGIAVAVVKAVSSDDGRKDSQAGERL